MGRHVHHHMVDDTVMDNDSRNAGHEENKGSHRNDTDNDGEKSGYEMMCV